MPRREMFLPVIALILPKDATSTQVSASCSKTARPPYAINRETREPAGYGHEPAGQETRFQTKS